MYKKIQGEAVQMSKNQLNKILQRFKPMITLLVTILESTAIAVIAVIVYELTLTAEGASLVKLLMLPNVPYLIWSLHPLVHGLYFTKIRQALYSSVKRIVPSCKLNEEINSISPGQACNDRSIRIAIKTQV